MSEDERVKIERYGHDAVLEITEAVLEHAIEFRMRVLRLNEELPILRLSEGRVT